MHTYQDSIDESLKETKSYFEKLYDEISKTLEKISSREKYINSQLEEPMQAFRNYQDRLAEVKETYRNRSTGINERTQMLAQVIHSIFFVIFSKYTFCVSKVTNDLQRIKEEMEEAGQSMTDGCKCLIIIYNFL